MPGFGRNRFPVGYVDDVPEEETLSIGAVILAPGYDLYDAEKKGEYGYRRFPNVVSGLDYERILSASGPFGGHIKRLSDGAEPKKIAFIQCVGSRDKDNPYCSSVCCMYTTKQAIVSAKEPILAGFIFNLSPHMTVWSIGSLKRSGRSNPHHQVGRIYRLLG